MITPIGNDLAANEVALRAGKCGVGRVPDFVEHKLSCEVGGLVQGPLETELIDRKKLRFCPPVGVMSVIAAQEAFGEAGLPLEELRERRIAIIGGVAGSNYIEVFNEADKYIRTDYRLRNVSPYSVPRVMPSSAISNLSLIFGITGESYDISAACASISSERSTPSVESLFPPGPRAGRAPAVPRPGRTKAPPSPGPAAGSPLPCPFDQAGHWEDRGG